MAKTRADLPKTEATTGYIVRNPDGDSDPGAPAWVALCRPCARPDLAELATEEQLAEDCSCAGCGAQLRAAARG